MSTAREGDEPFMNPGMIDEIVRRGWGLAGNLDSDRIIATKIPKSSNLVDYLVEDGAEKRRQLYCHCPRLRQAISLGVSISSTYCYCGAGFYRGIWEEILQMPVDIQVMKTVLQGDDVCKFLIQLPQ